MPSKKRRVKGWTIVKKDKIVVSGGFPSVFTRKQQANWALFEEGTRVVPCEIVY